MFATYLGSATSATSVASLVRINAQKCARNASLVRTNEKSDLTFVPNGTFVRTNARGKLLCAHSGNFCAHIFVRTKCAHKAQCAHMCTEVDEVKVDDVPFFH